MKRTLFCLAGTCAVLSLLFSCSGKPVLKKSSTELDSVSYSLGVYFGSQLKGANLKTIDVKVMEQAMRDVLNNDTTVKPEMTMEQANAFIQTYMRRIQLRDFEKKNKEAGDKFLKENKTKEGVVVLPSGLQYKVTQEGNGVKPRPTDTVEVYYKGTLLNGTVFDSTTEGEPVKFVLNQVIPGWTEGIQQISEGSKATLYIPQNLAYGENPNPYGPIEPYMMLIFDVELVKVIAPAETK